MPECRALLRKILAQPLYKFYGVFHLSYPLVNYADNKLSACKHNDPLLHAKS